MINPLLLRHITSHIEDVTIMNKTINLIIFVIIDIGININIQAASLYLNENELRITSTSLKEIR